MKDHLPPQLIGQVLPEKACQALAAWEGPIYFSGGVVRDWLLGRTPADIDLTVANGALRLARELANFMAAAFVPLSAAEGVARVVGADFCLDIAQFREGMTSIEADLGRRDFTVNALAVGFDPKTQTFADQGRLIDPLSGLADLKAGIIRLAHPQAFASDPLRLLRAYRFRAVFDWVIEPGTRKAIRGQAARLGEVSAERVTSELDRLLVGPAAFTAVREMADDGVLLAIFPELAPAVGLRQPASHHLDVFDHSLETLRQMGVIIERPQDFFPGLAGEIVDYLARPRQIIRLKYAALLHDLGKTVTVAEKNGRITFHHHDQAGAELLAAIGRRLRFSHDDCQRIGRLVGLHMWPFHLYNASLKTRITPKAILKLGRAAGDDLIGLFLLVMADSLAGQGPGKPPGMEAGVAALFAEVYRTYTARLAPLLAIPLLTGDDLIRRLGLTPGPLFARLLDRLQEQRAARPGMTREEALRWASEFTKEQAKTDVISPAGD